MEVLGIHFQMVKKPGEPQPWFLEEEEKEASFS
jgi:hypothetical protein